MKRKNVLSTDAYSTKSQKYDELLEEGISLIQKFSGEKWTDYNYHDPGITILEQLCYAITDIGYKTNFDIQDILMYQQDEFDFENKNLFFSPEKIFPSTPITIKDFRKLLINNISEVNNAWISSDPNKNSDIHGLYDIKIQLNDSIARDEFDKIILKTKRLLNSHRILCSDFNSIKILEKDIVSITANIQIDSFYVGEEILAKIFIEIENRLNSKVKSVGFEYFEGKEISPLELFQGVKTSNGIILDKDLKEKTNQIYVSEIVEIITKIEGISKVENFEIFKDGIRIFGDVITFSDNKYPSLEGHEQYFSNESLSKIVFVRNNFKYSIDEIIFSQIYDSMSLSEIGPILNKYKGKTIPKGRFKLGDFKKYYSIVNEFPALYGLKKKELDPKSPTERTGQMKQLKVYLYLFDQIMASNISLLSNIRNLFSIGHSDKTFYNQVPEDIYGLKELIKNNDKEQFQQNIQKYSENYEEYFKRKNMFIDHLLSRFGESYNSSILMNIHKHYNSNLTDYDANIYAIKAKTKYASKIIELGMDRNKAFNYLNVKDNISGFENRLKLLLNIEKEIPIPQIALDKNDFELVEKNIWSVSSKLINDNSVDLLQLPKSCYENGRANFYLNNYTAFKDIFINGVNRNSYKIVKIDQAFNILYQSENIDSLVKICKMNSENDCLEKIEQIIKSIIKLSETHEGFLSIEHILLRPLEVNDYSMNITASNNLMLFESIVSQDYKTLVNMRNNLVDLLKDRSNFSIHKNNIDKNSFRISIFDSMDNKILSSKKSFKTRKDAKKLIDEINLEGLDKLNINIISANKLNNTFPDEFNYSNEITLVIPEWPLKFQNIEFKRYFEEMIFKYLPSNIKCNIINLNFIDFRIFYDQMLKWRKAKRSNSKSIDKLSLDLIQLILKFKND